MTFFTINSNMAAEGLGEWKTSVTSSPDALIVTPDDFVTCVYK